MLLTQQQMSVIVIYKICCEFFITHFQQNDVSANVREYAFYVFFSDFTNMPFYDF